LAQLNEYFRAIGLKLAGKFNNNNKTELRKHKYGNQRNKYKKGQGTQVLRKY